MMASRSASAAGDTEKVSVNVGFVDLGQIDLLVQEGFYSTRTDFIRTAIRNQLDRLDMSLKSSVQRHEFELGMKHVSRLHLESVLAKNELVDLRVIGLMKIADDVSVQLARKTIGSIRVLGALRINPQLRKALQDRIL